MVATFLETTFPYSLPRDIYSVSVVPPTVRPELPPGKDLEFKGKICCTCLAPQVSDFFSSLFSISRVIDPELIKITIKCRQESIL